mmetsp:Transcript_2395/g.8104  ORF Transcript_2395/g.8104 Transcript_2395/m.8104 type:complete len:207 (-) Transcript_2395:791-1411(-)
MAATAPPPTTNATAMPMPAHAPPLRPGASTSPLLTTPLMSLPLLALPSSSPPPLALALALSLPASLPSLPSPASASRARISALPKSLPSWPRPPLGMVMVSTLLKTSSTRVGHSSRAQTAKATALTLMPIHATTLALFHGFSVLATATCAGSVRNHAHPHAANRVKKAFLSAVVALRCRTRADQRNHTMAAMRTASTTVPAVLSYR